MRTVRIGRGPCWRDWAGLARNRLEQRFDRL
jgi:hypothetical protein